MPQNYDAQLFNKTPYYDDYDEDKKFLRSLFKPGVAIQARELTQLQTVLQTQIERMGNHIFDNGAVIAGGGIAESKINYARLGTADALNTTVLSSLVGQQIYDPNYVNGTVLHVLSGSTLSSDPNQVVFYQYTSNGAFTEGTQIGTTGPDSVGVTFSIANTGTTAPSIGVDANIFTVDSGIFYIDGYFIKNTKQSAVPYYTTGNYSATTGDSRYRGFGSPTSSVGWSVERTVADHNSDVSLRDPSAGFNNYNAPGADRYAINLALGHIPFDGSLGSASGLTFDNKDFVELVRVVGGSSTKTVKYTDYAEIEETFARRTFDESGNYTVNAPKLRVVSHGSVFSPSDDTKFAVGIDPNKSYVGGFEVDTQSVAYLEVDKTRSIGEVPAYSENLDTALGNYVLVNRTGVCGGFDGASASEANESGMAMNNQRSFSIWTDYSSPGASIGSCNLRAISHHPTTNDMKAYIFNIGMSADFKFSSAGYLVADIGSGHTGATGVWFQIKSDSSGWTGPHDAGKRSLIFPVANNKTIGKTGPGNESKYNSKFVVQKTSTAWFDEDADGATVSMLDSKGLLDADNSNYVVWFGATADTESGVSAAILNPSEYKISVYGADSSNAKFVLNVLGMSGPAGGSTATITHPVVYDSNRITTQTGQKVYRTLTQTTQSATSISTTETVYFNGSTAAKFNLSHAHVYNVTDITNNGGNITLSDTTLEDGQRQSAFHRSSVYIPVSSLTMVNEEYVCQFVYDYYAHSGIGPVTVNSYPDSYEDVPSFNDPDSGKTMKLREHIDFRPVQNSNNTFTEYGIPFFKNTNSYSKIGYTYYMPRIDKVSLCKDRTYRVIKGVPSINPQSPQTSSEDMDLYLLKIRPYVFNIGKDIDAKYIDNRRFTMKTIGELENQVENVERDRHLESMYSDAIAKGAGVESTTLIEEGTLIDDFSGHAFSDVSNRDNNCSMDFKDRGLKVPFTTNALKFDINTLPTGLTLTSGRVVTYDFTEEKALGVSFGTSSLEVNPYGNTDFLGYLKLNPASDYWYDTETNPEVLVNSFGENNQYQTTGNAWQAGRSAGWGSEYGEWRSHWLGSEELNETISVADPSDRNYKLPVKSARAQLPDRVLRESGDKTVDESVVPYMRSVGVTFDATGLLPGSTVYALFDGILVGASGTGYSVDGQGAVSGRVTVDNSYLTGEKTFRLTSSNTDTLSSTTTAADAKFYSQGLLNHKSSNVISDRPAMSRRKSVNSDSIISGPYLNTVDGNYSSVQNGLDPLTQEIIVDGGAFPQGVFLSSIELFFKKADASLPVTIDIRPMINGAPHDFLIVPHSEVTVLPTTTSDGPNAGQGTKFSFESPVYLPPGNWAIGIMSNSSNNILFRAEVGRVWLDIDGTQNSNSDIYGGIGYGNGIRPGKMFKPLNNGSRQSSSLENVTMNVHRCSFNGGSLNADQRTLILDATMASGSTAYGHTTNVVSNEQLFTSESIKPNYNLFVNGVEYSGIVPNKDIVLESEQIIDETGDMRLQVEYGNTTSSILTPVLDMDRIGSLLIMDRFSWSSIGSDTGLVLGETQKNSAGAATIARYVSKKLHFGNQIADDLRVYLDIARNQGHVKVFAKVNNDGEDFNNINWVQLYKDGKTEKEWWDDTQQEVLTPITFQPASGTSLGEFDVYAVKIVIFGGEPDDQGSSNHNANDIPTIKNLKAVALKSSS
jgi:hypothetical protein